jgi:3-oxoacyl-[acyl-carrier-protein] synthase-3
LLEVSPKGKVVLLNCDTLSRKACPHDRNIFPLLGDAGTITILESTDEENEILLDIKIDGTRSNWLMIPAGAMRQPSTDQTREIRVLPDGNKRSEEDFFMNGSGVFTFTQTDVPTSIKEFFKANSRNFDEIDYFMFHQPNRFMLEKVAKKLGIPKEKIPSNIVEKFGNSSSASIPVTITHNVDTILLEKKLTMCMAGFGVGLSWGTLIMDMGPLEFCELIEK